MTEPVSAIRNLGPASVDQFARAGIHSAEEVRALGAEAAYRRLILAGTRPHFIGFYALVMGLQGRRWNDLGPDEKAELRVVFDRLVAGIAEKAKGRSDFEAALDMLGVRDPDVPGRR
ncbi:TfoX/Sxy family protein [Limibaculum sp. M0105]|uniref:TfoX/Sxy family protein n=1 Tax=Thermohalobaculum xanthum TaxID=2753746 RepID=A0A8J7SE98_9RHOB|nr:TfoX/Sxy family protein [Thermohalobaculum xanthum]MBK0399703.1 TfoX/Sxy family protein [Thermohalobaculum xanthum]